ncbi:GMC family oxidoreductase [Parashewanella curva]|uniref:GMC family oxidoreductase n=1 Tax=Parashewanella curva TaxID=2338552 RepID=A0A3L8PXZ7_9GAMM|nr:GMC family oxidoreductase [Parashewanella curva]RLV59503.1 GMC family oxidoreductase [Parashewanella curva]
MTHDAEVIIIGSGVAGALAAWKLSQANIKVIVLEAGPYFKDREKHAQKFRIAGASQGIDTPYQFHPEAPKPNANDTSNYYVQTGPEPFKGFYQRIVGGTTWHWMGICPRFLPEDFSLKKHFGVGVNWPLNYQQIEPYYGQAENALGVSGDSTFDAGSDRSTDYPNPPLKQSYLDQVLSQNCDGLLYHDIPLKVSVAPQAKQPWCKGSGSCIPLCPTGAKYEANTHINLAKKHGAAIIAKAVVHRLDEHHGRIRSVRYLDWDGHEHKLTAKYFMLAANAIETPKILLMSKSARYPKGLANRSDMVGRNLMDHPLVISQCLSPVPVYGFRGPIATSSIESFRTGDFRKHFSSYRINIHNNGWASPHVSPYADFKNPVKEFKYGDELQQVLKDRIQRQILIDGAIEQLPNYRNRVSLSRHRSDKFGLPHPEIYYHFTEYEQKGLKDINLCFEAMFTKLQASEILHIPEVLSSGHIMGTCKMGLSAWDSVVLPSGRTHEHKNLYILGSSVFPTSGTANPTLTIAALTLRTTESLIKILRN